MTEKEWLESDDPEGMLHLLRMPEAWGATPTLPSDRKLRLFACGCVRQIWHLLEDERCRLSVDVAEMYADEQVTERDLMAADHKVHSVWVALPSGPQEHAAAAAWWMVTSRESPEDYPVYVPNTARSAHLAGATKGNQAALLRDLVGSPSRIVGREIHGAAGTPLVVWPGGEIISLEMALLRRDRPTIIRRAWLTPEVLGMARTAYEERLPTGFLDPQRLAVLSDALEENGCDDERMLRHLRGEQPVLREDRRASGQVVGPPLFRLVGWKPLGAPHARGCWVIDALLGKE